MVRQLNTNRFNRLDVLVLAIIILVGLVHLPFPFDADHWLFSQGALEISNGGILYRDFWDLKQPAIFGFYLLAGTLFGFNEIGIHMFELLYLVTFSMVLIMTLKGYYKNPWMASLVPLLTVGVYYGVSQFWMFAMVEGLVGFPMFLSLLFASKSSQPEGNKALWLFLSGFMGGIVLLFKFMFLPILAAFWLTTLIDAVVRRHEHLLTALVRIGAPIALGVLFPLLIVFSYFARFDMLELLYWTYFKYPSLIVNEIPLPPMYKLLESTRWFIGKFAPLMALGFLGACSSLSSRRDLMTMNLLLWCILGFGVILLQVQSWWLYQYLLLFVPLGVLSAKGLDVLWEKIKGSSLSTASWRSSIVTVLSLTLLFSPIVGSIAKRALLLGCDGFALKREQRLKYQERFNPAYPTMIADVAFLSKPESLPGDIYVFGDSLYYFFSGREQAIPIHGRWIRILVSEQWIQLTEQLSKALPPYIYVAAKDADLIRKRSPKTAKFIEKNYRMLRRSEGGVWYVIQ